jgi:Fe2+ transport system protein B
MDKVKQNIILQQQLDKFNIEKSVIGTEAYEINQDIQKGMSQDEIIEKARSGVYKLTAENKKAGRVGQRYGSEGKEKVTMNNLDWGQTTSERNENLDKYHSLKTEEEKNEFAKKLKNLNESKYSKESTEKKEGKSKAASKVLQLMDSEPDGELHYGKYVSQVVKEMGVNREELEKELDKYV